MSLATKDPRTVSFPRQLESVAVPADEDVSIKEVVTILWRHKVLIATVSVLMTAAALAVGYVLPRSYEASVTLSPVTDETAGASRLGAVSSLMASVGLGGLAGGAGADGKRAESLALLQSRSLTERYIQEKNLLPVFFKDRWDAGAGKWNVADPEKIPTLWDGNEYFSKKVRLVTEDAKSGMVKLTISWHDPKLAASWANDLVKLTNDTARTRAIQEAERNISYLNEQASKTNVTEVRQTIYQILQEEMKKEMLARGREEYALKVIDVAEAPRNSSSPGKALWALGGLVGGALLGVIFTLAKVAWNSGGAPARSRRDFSGDPAGSAI